MNALIRVLYVIVGIINLAPASGALSKDRLQALYGVSLVDPNLVILMHHRAVLLGIVGGLLIAAAFHRPLRTTALFAGLLSMLSFVVIAIGIGEFNHELRRVILVDLVALVLLVAAGLTGVWSHSRGAAR